MLKKGITTFVDFREGGMEGITMLKEVLTDVPIRSIILGRLEFYQSENPLLCEPLWSGVVKYYPPKSRQLLMLRHDLQQKISQLIG